MLVCLIRIAFFPIPANLFSRRALAPKNGGIKGWNKKDWGQVGKG
jgi:hypothetical protein